MTCKESVKWLESLKKELGQSQYQGLWNYEQALAETIELLQSDRLVELPCKLGDQAYKIIKSTAFGNRIQNMTIERIALVAHTDFDDFEIISQWGLIYFDKSKAEAKLKELNKNEQEKA